MKIIIPTLQHKINKQSTFNNLFKLKEHIWFVTDKNTAKELCGIHNQICVVDKNNVTHVDLIEYIVKDRFIGQTVWVVNDNVEFAKYSTMPNEKYLLQRKISREPRLMLKLWNTLNMYAKRFDNGGLFSAIIPPESKNWPGIQNNLYINNFWLNLKKINLTNIDFKCQCRPDLLIFLTILQRQHSSALIYEYGIHNNADIQLNNKEIEFIKNNFDEHVNIDNNKISFKAPSKTITQNTFSDFFVEQPA